MSYALAKLTPIRPERSFEDWVVNRFGRKLFDIFFKTYTEKVWGMPCREISADWAAQRIQGLSLAKALLNALPLSLKHRGAIIKTLIDRFEYPRLGPGMMWEKTRNDISAQGGDVFLGLRVDKILIEGARVLGVEAFRTNGERAFFPGEAFILSMPLRDAVLAMEPPLAANVRAAAQALAYRDFLTVALMVRQADMFPDNWIYVHDPGVKLGRIQNFNNWSPQMVPGKGVTCLGLEYFCFEGDGMWTMSDEELIELGKSEMEALGLLQAKDVFDGAVVRMEKAYPVYTPDYIHHIRAIRQALDRFSNLQVVGRNGMHKYNNQDHSMMSALLAARNAVEGENWDLWKINTDAQYLEEEEAASVRKMPKRLGCCATGK
jgi:protoporphyrinogen oxidase